MKTIKIAGVPEHFNLPWHLCIENGEFEHSGIDLQWTDVPEGTGKMCQMLRNGETDVAIILSEGIVRDIIEGNPSKIVQVFVRSPLLWGIHVDNKSPYRTANDLRGKKAAISRYGSGSHLMSFVNAKNLDFPVEELAFEVVHTVEGAVKALQKGTADYFLWERFTTQPLVDKKIFRRIGECPTPWPCFVIAVRNKILDDHPDSVRLILDIINATTLEFKQIPCIDRTLAFRYGQKLDDIKSWLEITHWSQKNITPETLNKIQNQLLELTIINKKGTFADMVYSQ